MAGQIIKKSDRVFLVRIFQGRDAAGKRRYFSKQIRGTRKDAQKFLNAALREIDLVHWKLSFLILSIVSIDFSVMPVQFASR